MGGQVPGGGRGDRAPTGAPRAPAGAVALRRSQSGGVACVGDVGGGEVGAGAVPACGVAPSAGGVAGDVDVAFHH